MRRVGVRDFKDHATALLASGETLIVERHGTPVGFYVPVQAIDRPSGRAALSRLATALSEAYERAGVSEDEAVAEITRARRRRA